jgi:hypothetical protein
MVGFDVEIGGSLNPEPQSGALRYGSEIGDVEGIGVDAGSEERLPEPDVGSGGESSLEEMIFFELESFLIMREVWGRGVGLEEGHGLTLATDGELEDGLTSVGVEGFTAAEEVQDGAAGEAFGVGEDVVRDGLTLIGETELGGLDAAPAAEEVLEGKTIETALLSDELGDDVTGILVRAVFFSTGAAEGELACGSAFEPEPDDETACEQKLPGGAIPAKRSELDEGFFELLLEGDACEPSWVFGIEPLATEGSCGIAGPSCQTDFAAWRHDRLENLCRAGSKGEGFDVGGFDGNDADVLAGQGLNPGLLDGNGG